MIILWTMSDSSKNSSCASSFCCLSFFCYSSVASCCLINLVIFHYMLDGIFCKLFGENLEAWCGEVFLWRRHSFASANNSGCYYSRSTLRHIHTYWMWNTDAPLIHTHIHICTHTEYSLSLSLPATTYCLSPSHSYIHTI